MHCHTEAANLPVSSGGSIALVGHPNVGKSVIFQFLTGQHVAISNYPGTTVEVARGVSRTLPNTVVVDTPGVVTFPPHSDDEQVTARVLLSDPLSGVLQVGDAKNLKRTLLLTVQLAEMGLPLVLVLNMMDEARARGVQFDPDRLAGYLGVTVLPTTAVRGEGMEAIPEAIQQTAAPHLHLSYPAEVEAALTEMVALFAQEGLAEHQISGRSLALGYLSADASVESWLAEKLPAEALSKLESRRTSLRSTVPAALETIIQKTRLAFVEQVVEAVLVERGEAATGLAARLGRLSTHPVWGMLILGIVLYVMYWFVGVLGAGTLVNFLENQVFGSWLNPFITGVVQRILPVPFFSDLLVGKYGLWTMGITYALALILPIVTTFFLAFSVMEDSGYLPRLAALSNRMFQALGLNGKAVLPMVLGLGCVTMATVTTRVLESKRERLLVTLLLALAVPCSAQLGVVMGMLAGISLEATIIWGGVVFAVLLLVGWLASRLVAGERTQLLVELPPMRLPMASNVFMKTLARLEWYLKEVVPLFLLGTFIMFALDKTGVLSWLIHLGEPLVSGWLGLPPQASAAFLMGFLRRDFGATGLFMMESQGLMTPLQVVVAMVTITLFIPCVASVMMIAKERSWRTAAGMLIIIFPLAFLIGGLLNRALIFFGWGIL